MKNRVRKRLRVSEADLTSETFYIACGKPPADIEKPLIHSGKELVEVIVDESVRET